MKLVENMRRLGSLMFLFMWLPFTCIFVGMAEEMGGFGLLVAAWVDRLLPGMLTLNDSGMSTLSEISLTITIALSVLSMVLIFGSPALAALLNRRLINSGRQATAKIISLEQTGTTINDNPVVRFVLEVDRPDGSPFHAEAERLVPLVQIPRLQPGASVQVRYDPNTLEVAISDEN
jgi:hypothetical protein